MLIKMESYLFAERALQDLMLARLHWQHSFVSLVNKTRRFFGFSPTINNSGDCSIRRPFMPRAPGKHMPANIPKPSSNKQDFVVFLSARLGWLLPAFIKSLLLKLIAQTRLQKGLFNLLKTAHCF